MCQAASPASAQQSAIQQQISMAVAKQAQNSTKLQGQAVVQQLAASVQSPNTPGTGGNIDSAG